MKIWRMINPHGYTYALCSLRGSWHSYNCSKSPCPVCKSTLKVRVPPSIIEWEPGSEVVGDFTWPDASETLICTLVVFELLNKQFGGFNASPVEMIQDPSLKRPKRSHSRTKPRVWLPYVGPELCELWIDAKVTIDKNRSNIRLVQSCKYCGATIYSVEGIEERKSHWNCTELRLEPFQRPREPGKGLYVSAQQLKGHDIFRTQEFPTWILCTDPVKEFIVGQRLSNISFLEYGEVVN